MLKTPVVLIIFRRAGLTARVLQAIGQAQPRQLFVVADGPRPDRPQDIEDCAATRAVIDQVNWKCEVVKHYAETNLGCGRRPATGISWVFEHVNEAIILEDDCLPHPTFFRFCEEMLDRYREDERIMHIAGSNLLKQPVETPFSYQFSCFNTCWGWATWRRAWQHFDAALKLWPQLRETTWLADLLGESAVRLWQGEFERAWQRQGEVSYWDQQWSFACWAHSGLSVAPRSNLISNIGFSKDATHTLDAKDYRAELASVALEFPLQHPPNILRCTETDRQIIRELLLAYTPSPQPQPGAYQRMRERVSRALPAPVKKTLRRALGRA